MIRLGVIGFGRRMRHMVGVVEVPGGGAGGGASGPARGGVARGFPTALEGRRRTRMWTRMLDGGEPRQGDDRDALLAAHTDGDPGAGAGVAALPGPVAISFEQAALRERARTTSQVVVSFPLRVSALCTTAREIIDSGAIGTVENVQAIQQRARSLRGYYHGWMRD
ncbi:MAG: hypothetical protein U0232_26545 [Thermomicrobiales bacterium]